MAVKTNVTINGVDYYRLRKTIGKDKKGNPVRKPFYGKNKRDAERKYKEWLERDQRGIKDISQTTSLTEAMYTWLWQVEFYSGNKENTFSRYESVYRNYIEESELGYMIIGDIEMLTVQMYYTKLFECGYTYSQIINLNKPLKKFFRFANEEGYIRKNPCTGVNLAAYKEEVDEILDFDDDFDDELDGEGVIEAFTPEELKILIPSIKNEKLKLIAKFALVTGLRQGEILALNENDIKDMVVRVTKTVGNIKMFTGPDEYTYEVKVTRPKTKRSRRKVPIPSDFKSDLQRITTLKKEEKLKAGPAYTDNKLLFPSTTGTYIDARNLLRAWQRVFGYIEVPYKTFHSLRHTYATLLINNKDNGMDIVELSRLMGHSSIETTQKYAKILLSTKKESVESLNSTLSSII